MIHLLKFIVCHEFDERTIWLHGRRYMIFYFVVFPYCSSFAFAYTMMWDVTALHFSCQSKRIIIFFFSMYFDHYYLLFDVLRLCHDANAECRIWNHGRAQIIKNCLLNRFSSRYSNAFSFLLFNLSNTSIWADRTMENRKRTKEKLCTLNHLRRLTL